ncbi:hypothetical protein Vadar_000552 [Vaccinium darrowii]|uniref:Uncharacterized protein n=1 Tax=Vaccinium darrowii TaxID=229202 RepID=A0ACB7XEJ0_9ERIC|nr:hypothetical protein Vadar_000552 [Vaccinium darrowii]
MNELRGDSRPVVFNISSDDECWGENGRGSNNIGGVDGYHDMFERDSGNTWARKNTCVVESRYVKFGDLVICNIELFEESLEWKNVVICSHNYPNVAILSKQCGDKNRALTAAFEELQMVYGSVCKIHMLPLALTWVSCSHCNNFLLSQLSFKGLEFFEERNGCLTEILEASKWRRLRKGQVTERILQFPNLLYCSDVKKLCIAEYPLVPYARQCNLSGWFTISLRSSFTSKVYVLELFLPVSSKESDNMLTTLSLILGTMDENFKTFQLASGQELGEVLSVEVIDFQNDQKSYSIQTIQATRFSPSWNSDLPSDQASNSVTNTKPGFQDANMVTMKAKYENYTIKFTLPLSSGLVELQQEVAKRLNLVAGTYDVVHKDEEDDVILIACDEDLQACVRTSRSQGNKSIVLLLEVKQPTTNFNPIT